LPAAKIEVVPNFLEPDPGEGDGPRNGLLFVGRLTQDKGVPTLLRAAALAPGLVRVAGTGPLASQVGDAARTGDLEELGRLDKKAVFEQLRGAVAMVLPSVWFEGFPMAVLEAYATGTPVIASGIGSLGEVVKDGVTGLLVPPGDEARLADRLRWANEHRDEMRRMGSNARLEYEARYRGPAHLDALLGTYDRLIEAGGSFAFA
jgi:glycosyltransferase involved in cell wall biosynthesis